LFLTAILLNLYRFHRYSSLNSGWTKQATDNTASA
jgi:hypothetical protein